MSNTYSKKLMNGPKRARREPRSESWANKELARSRVDMRHGLDEWFNVNRRKGS